MSHFSLHATIVVFVLAVKHFVSHFLLQDTKLAQRYITVQVSVSPDTFGASSSDR